MAAKKLMKVADKRVQIMSNTPTQKQIREDKAKCDAIVKQMTELTDQDIIDICKRVGVGGVSGKFYTCYLCGELKPVSDFYKATDANAKTGITRICRECAKKIVYSVDDYGEQHESTKESMLNALEYLDKPFVENVFDSSLVEAENRRSAGHMKLADPWSCYVKTINSMPQYTAARWRDSDRFSRTYHAAMADIPLNAVQEAPADMSADAMERYAINKRDVIRFVGYDPFDNYPIEADKPLLYSQIVSFLDDETKNDGMKLAAVIQIVKKLNQAEKLNDQINALLTDHKNAMANQQVINKMMATSKSAMDIAGALAKDNGISINYNNNKSKGSSTLSGKMKKLEEEGLREEKINMFDVGTCKGMLQVAEISEKARHEQIGYDENIAQEIKDIKVELVESLTKELDECKERARILLVENKDLKDYMKEKGLMDESGKLIRGDG